MSLIADSGDIAGLFLLGAAIALVTGATRQRRVAQAAPPAMQADQVTERADQATEPAGQATEPAEPVTGSVWEPAAAPWQAVLQEPVSAPALPVLVEDRLSGPASLELEETVGTGDQYDPVPEPCGILAARDR